MKGDIRAKDIGQYKYGFHDSENYVFVAKAGREVVETISRMKGEPEDARFRLKAFELS
jgi:hypothetical protein